MSDCDGVEICENCLVRDQGSDGGGYVRNSDPDDISDVIGFAQTPSPVAELLRLNDLFCRKFTVDDQYQGRMVLLNPQSTVEADSESDDMTSTREGRSEREVTASTLSLNDLLDDDSAGSSDPSTPEGCDNLSISDYEQLVIEGCPTALADSSSLLPPPPLSLLHNGYSPSTQVKYMFIPVSEHQQQHADSSTDSSDYTNLADDEATMSDLPNPVSSCATGSGLNASSAVSGQLLNGVNQKGVRTFLQSDVLPDKDPGCQTSCSMLVNGLNGVHRPTVLLTRRRKRASVAASAFVRGIQQNGECHFTNLSSDGQPRSNSKGCGSRMVVLYKDCLDGSGTGSSDDCGSLESLDPPGFRSSDGGDTVVCDKPFSSQDDGYCTAKSSVAVQLACCQQHLGKITSASEVDTSVDGNSLQNSSEVDDSTLAQALPGCCTNLHNEKSNVFGCPIVARVQLENSHHRHLDMSGIQLVDVLDSSDLDTDVGDVVHERYSSQSSMRSVPSQSGSSLADVMMETCRRPPMVESPTDCPVRQWPSVRHELDGDVRQAIDMFAFLDDHEPSVNSAASNTSR